MRDGEIVAQVEIEQVDDGLKGFRRNQANRQAMHFFADRIVFFAKGNQFSKFCLGLAIFVGIVLDYGLAGLLSW